MALNKISSNAHYTMRPQLAGGRESSSEASWTPNTDVYVTESGLVIKVELAGMRKEDLELTVDGNQLRISGVRRDCCRAPQCKFVVMEINYGQFESLIELPPGYDLGHAKAAYQNGFLRIDVPGLTASQGLPGPVPVATAES
ncbi:MAG: Hsp20/alpha crystallin family protein [Verrucomicrobia bacterium]|nr:Hsp20/alpha crystallin family protein [Verrucomicrobiota bacterium]